MSDRSKKGESPRTPSDSPPPQTKPRSSRDKKKRLDGILGKSRGKASNDVLTTSAPLSYKSCLGAAGATASASTPSVCGSVEGREEREASRAKEVEARCVRTSSVGEEARAETPSVAPRSSKGSRLGKGILSRTDCNRSTANVGAVTAEARDVSCDVSSIPRSERKSKAGVSEASGVGLDPSIADECPRVGSCGNTVRTPRKPAISERKNKKQAREKAEELAEGQKMVEAQVNIKYRSAPLASPLQKEIEKVVSAEVPMQTSEQLAGTVESQVTGTESTHKIDPVSSSPAQVCPVTKETVSADRDVALFLDAHGLGHLSSLSSLFPAHSPLCNLTLTKDSTPVGGSHDREREVPARQKVKDEKVKDNSRLSEEPEVKDGRSDQLVSNCKALAKNDAPGEPTEAVAATPSATGVKMRRKADVRTPISLSGSPTTTSVIANRNSHTYGGNVIDEGDSLSSSESSTCSPLSASTPVGPSANPGGSSAVTPVPGVSPSEVVGLSCVGGGSGIQSGPASGGSILTPASVVTRRLLARTMSEDIRARQRKESMTHSQSSSHLICSNSMSPSNLLMLPVFAGGSLRGRRVSIGGAGVTTSETSNLLRMRNSSLRHSAPSLTTSLKDINLSSSLSSKRGSGSGRHSFLTPSKKNLFAHSSSRCLSPAGPYSTSSPCESPRLMSPVHPTQFSFAPSKRGSDLRRLSVYSAASSGYNTNPTGSALSSEYSSQERLGYGAGGVLTQSATEADIRSLSLADHRRSLRSQSSTSRYSSNESNPPPIGQQQGADGSCPAASAGETSPVPRVRSRSLGSRSPHPWDHETALTNSVYRERFPKAIETMEARLAEYIDRYRGVLPAVITQEREQQQQLEHLEELEKQQQQQTAEESHQLEPQSSETVATTESATSNIESLLATAESPMTTEGSPMTTEGSPVTTEGSSMTTERSSMTTEGSPMATEGSPMATTGASHTPTAGTLHIVTSKSPTSTAGSPIATTGSPAAAAGLLAQTTDLPAAVSSPSIATEVSPSSVAESPSHQASPLSAAESPFRLSSPLSVSVISEAGSSVCGADERDGAGRFAHHQIVELARDCLERSWDHRLSALYFCELSDNVEKLRQTGMERSTTSVQAINSMAQEFILIINRPWRLLECLEFDADEFRHLLNEAEGRAKQIQISDIPRYIIGKLGLIKDPREDLSSSVSSQEDTSAADGSTSNLSCAGAEGRHAAEGLAQYRLSPKEDSFTQIKVISNGAFGCVYLVRHKETKQRYAMKKIMKSNVVHRNQVEQVFTERDILTFMDNPFVVSLLCTFETKKHLCMVMEYVEGGDCATLLKNMGPLTMDMSRMYFAEAVLALEYLHDYGIVHRDLKPDNLLITNTGHIKLTDFGLSKVGIMNLATNMYEGYLSDQSTRQFKDRQIFGTPEYIAPEVILRRGYGTTVDWWSMGIILYEFLVGCVPFFGDTPEELFSHVLGEGIEWPEEDEYSPPADAKDLVHGLLMREASERLGSRGSVEVKDHIFFSDLDWLGLLRRKAEFVPELEGDEDTSYFDTRADRYEHEVMGDSSGADEGDDEAVDPMFSSFSSCSPRYFTEMKECSRTEDRTLLSEQSSTKSSSSEMSLSSSSAGVATTPQDAPTPEFQMIGHRRHESDSSLVAAVAAAAGVDGKVERVAGKVSLAASMSLPLRETAVFRTISDESVFSLDRRESDMSCSDIATPPRQDSLSSEPSDKKPGSSLINLTDCSATLSTCSESRQADAATSKTTDAARQRESCKHSQSEESGGGESTLGPDGFPNASTTIGDPVTGSCWSPPYHSPLTPLTSSDSTTLPLSSSSSHSLISSSASLTPSDGTPASSGTDSPSLETHRKTVIPSRYVHSAGSTGGSPLSSPRSGSYENVRGGSPAASPPPSLGGFSLRGNREMGVVSPLALEDGGKPLRMSLQRKPRSGTVPLIGSGAATVPAVSTAAVSKETVTCGTDETVGPSPAMVKNTGADTRTSTTTGQGGAVSGEKLSHRESTKEGAKSTGTKDEKQTDLVSSPKHPELKKVQSASDLKVAAIEKATERRQIGRTKSDVSPGASLSVAVGPQSNASTSVSSMSTSAETVVHRPPKTSRHGLTRPRSRTSPVPPLSFTTPPATLGPSGLSSPRRIPTLSISASPPSAPVAMGTGRVTGGRPAIHRRSDSYEDGFSSAYRGHVDSSGNELGGRSHRIGSSRNTGHHSVDDRRGQQKGGTPPGGQKTGQLSLLIPPSSSFTSPISPTSSASSRDQSPSRENVVAALKRLPIIINCGPRGYGFTVRAVHTYLDESDNYMLNHFIVNVVPGSPAQDAGLKTGWVITHVNNEQVQGLVHTQVIHLILQKRSKLALRALPIEETSICNVARRRPPHGGKMVGKVRLPGESGRGVGRSSGGGAASLRKSGSIKDRGGAGHWSVSHSGGDKRQRHRSSSNSLLRKLSKRNAEQHVQQQQKGSGVGYEGLSHSLPGGDSSQFHAAVGGGPIQLHHSHSHHRPAMSGGRPVLVGSPKGSITLPAGSGLIRPPGFMSLQMDSSPLAYSSSSSPSSSGPNSPASSFNAGGGPSRPTTLQGMKYPPQLLSGQMHPEHAQLMHQVQQHHLHQHLQQTSSATHGAGASSNLSLAPPIVALATPVLHALAQASSPNRRKSIHAIPLSPLARASPGSSPLALSPTAFPSVATVSLPISYSAAINPSPLTAVASGQSHFGGLSSMGTATGHASTASHPMLSSVSHVQTAPYAVPGVSASRLPSRPEERGSAVVSDRSSSQAIPASSPMGLSLSPGQRPLSLSSAGLEGSSAPKSATGGSSGVVGDSHSPCGPVSSPGREKDLKKRSSWQEPKRSSGHM